MEQRFIRHIVLFGALVVSKYYSDHKILAMSSIQLFEIFIVYITYLIGSEHSKVAY